KSLMGVVGLETAFPVLYTQLVLSGRVSLHRLIEAMAVAPRRVFGLDGGKIEVGERADLALLDLNKNWTIEGAKGHSKGSSTP
ncbi:MAG: amidohydrolase family protein, partial [Clostridia bacterium]